MSKQSDAASGGIGVLGLLGVLFVALKLLGKIDWSWWYVTLPFWGGIVLVFSIIILVLVFMGFMHLLGKK